MSNVKPLVILVEMRIRPGKAPDFMPLIRENATRSLADEPGCRRFDVLVPVDGENRVVLYEVYDGEQSFDAHRQMPHFARFKAASRDLLEQSTVQRLNFAP